MAAPDRILGKNIVVDFDPDGVTEQTSVWNLTLTDTPTSGTFVLLLNGQQTAPIAHDASATDIQDALEALDGVESGDAVVAAGTAPVDFTVTAAQALANRYNDLALAAETLDVGTITVGVETQGQGTITLTADFTAFEFNTTTDTVDVTASNEEHRYMKPTIQSLEWSATLYNSRQPYKQLLSDLTEGVITVYETGKNAGSHYFSYRTTFNGFSMAFAFDDSVQIDIGGERQGKNLVDFGTLYTP